MNIARSLLAASLLVGCAGKTGAETAPGPIHVDPRPTSDVEVWVLADAGTDRVVSVNFAVGAKLAVECALDEMVDGCAVETCTHHLEPVPGTPVDLGSVTVDSVSLGTQPLVPKMGSTWAEIIQQGDFAVAEVVHAKSTGSAAFPAFDLDVTIPMGVTLLPAGNCEKNPNHPGPATTCTLEDSAPILHWSGGGDVVVVGLTDSLDVPETKALHCYFDAKPGVGQIPASALARLTPGRKYGADILSRSNAVSSGRVTLTASRWNYVPVQYYVKVPQ